MGYQAIKARRTISSEHLFYDCLEFASGMEESNLIRLGEIIKSNTWCHYYCKCEAEIDGWIDFEKEIYPVIELFENIFRAECDVRKEGGDVYAIISKELFSKQQVRVANLWKKFVGVQRQIALIVNAPYVSLQYGVLKKEIIKELRKDFDLFIEAFELYLLEFVDKRNAEVKLLKQIKDIGVDYVISLNYTLTEALYGIDESKVHHIHGKIRRTQESKNNMVVGVSEQRNSNIDFVYFVKYFQRIKKASGTQYKKFIHQIYKDECRVSSYQDFSLYIYGHSLDETDADILKYVIGCKVTDEELRLEPKEVTIFYYDDADYEQKVTNLINLYGRSIVEKYIEDNKFIFVETNGDIYEK